MALKIGRIGYLGLGVESSPGTAVPSTTTIPFINNTIHGKHTPLQDISARASRAKDYGSVIGKQWSEGEVDVNVDTLNIGFLLKCALGNETVNTISAPNSVYDHLFYTTVSGNTPTTATLYNYQGVDVQQYASMAVDKFDLEIKDGLATAKVGWKGFFPTSGAHTLATVSGTLLNYSGYTMKLGSTLTLAGAASASAVTDFILQIKNNVDVIYESGQSRTSRVFMKQFEVGGSFTRFFESPTDRDNYYNLNKQSLILTASGIGLPGGSVESLTINLAKLAYTDVSITTGLDTFYAVKTTFTGEVDVVQGKQMDIVLRNFRSSAYT
jgi:hypothetical protein